MFLVFLLSIVKSKASDSLVSVKLHSQVINYVAGEQFYIAVELTPKDDWHTYWRNAGDAGLPTVVIFDLPKGVEISDTLWQIPKKFFFEGMANYGFSKTHYIFYKAKVPKNYNEPTLEINAVVSWLVCKDVCLPGKDTSVITLNRGDKLLRNNAFDKFFNNLPIVSNRIFNSKLIDNKILINSNEINSLLAEYNINNSNNNNIAFIPYEDGFIDNGSEQKNVHFDGNEYLEINLARFRTADPEKLKGIIIISEDKAIEVTINIIN